MNKEIASGYILNYGKGSVSLNLSSGLTLVPGHVFAYSLQNDVILVKAHPTYLTEHSTIESIVTTDSLYYIMRIVAPVTKQTLLKEIVNGPLMRNDFDSLVMQLGILQPKYEVIDYCSPSP